MTFWYPLALSNTASCWKIPHTSWENRRTKWWIFNQHLTTASRVRDPSLPPKPSLMTYQNAQCNIKKKLHIIYIYNIPKLWEKNNTVSCDCLGVFSSRKPCFQRPAACALQMLGHDKCARCGGCCGACRCGGCLPLHRNAASWGMTADWLLGRSSNLPWSRGQNGKIPMSSTKEWISKCWVFISVIC